MKSSMEACSWLERSAQTSFAAALASLLSISSILPFPGFFLPHSYAFQSPHFCEMAFCVGLFFPFSPFSVSLVKWNLTLREGGSLFLCLFITQNWRQTAGLRRGAVCLTLSLWQAWCLAVVRAQFHVPSFSPATFALHSYYQAVKPRWVSSDRFLAQAGDLPLVWWVGVVTLSWQQGVWTEVTTWGPACACLFMLMLMLMLLPREELWYPPGMSFLLVEGSCQDRELLIMVSIYSMVFNFFWKTAMQVKACAKF